MLTDFNLKEVHASLSQRALAYCCDYYDSSTLYSFFSTFGRLDWLCAPFGKICDAALQPWLMGGERDFSIFAMKAIDDSIKGVDYDTLVVKLIYICLSPDIFSYYKIRSSISLNLHLLSPVDRVGAILRLLMMYDCGVFSLSIKGFEVQVEIRGSNSIGYSEISVKDVILVEDVFAIEDDLSIAVLNRDGGILFPISGEKMRVLEHPLVSADPISVISNILVRGDCENDDDEAFPDVVLERQFDFNFPSLAIDGYLGDNWAIIEVAEDVLDIFVRRMAKYYPALDHAKGRRLFRVLSIVVGREEFNRLLRVLSRIDGCYPVLKKELVFNGIDFSQYFLRLLRLFCTVDGFIIPVSSYYANILSQNYWWDCINLTEEQRFCIFLAIERVLCNYSMYCEDLRVLVDLCGVGHYFSDIRYHNQDHLWEMARCVFGNMADRMKLVIRDYNCGLYGVPRKQFDGFAWQSLKCFVYCALFTGRFPADIVRSIVDFYSWDFASIDCRLVPISVNLSHFRDFTAADWRIGWNSIYPPAVPARTVIAGLRFDNSC